jgi:hypothetical protein
MLKLIVKTLALLLVPCSALPAGVGHADEIAYESSGGWNVGTLAQSIELEAGTRYLLSFEINCTDLDKYGAIFLTTRGRSGQQKVASIYPGVFNEFVEVLKVIVVAEGAADAKLYFGSHGRAAYTVRNIEVVPLCDMQLALDLPSDGSVALFDPSEGCTLRFNISNYTGRDFTGLLRVQVIDSRSPSKVYQDFGQVNAAIANQASQTFDLGAFKAQAGLYVLRLSNLEKTVFMEHNIGMSLPNKGWQDDEADRVFFGLHMPHYALWNFPKQEQRIKGANLLQHIGVGIVRIKMPWYEDAAGNLNFYALDEALAILKEHRIQVLAEIPNTIPRQYITPPKPPTKEKLKEVGPWLNLDTMLSPKSYHILSVRPSDMDALQRYATALAEKLKVAGVGYIELGNEPDWWDFFMGDYQDYSDTYSVKYEAMIQVDPEFNFMNGGLTLLNAVDERFLEKLLVDKADSMDAVAFHSYDRPSDELVGQDTVGNPTKLAELQQRMQNTGVNKPIWMTEGNVYTQTEYTVAKEIAKKFAIYKLHGVANYTYYLAKTDSHLGFQLMNNHFEPTMTALAYATSVRFMRNKTASRRRLPEGFVGVELGEDVLLVWLDSENCAEYKELSIKTGQSSIVYDFLGKPIAQATSGHLKLKLGNDPVFIVSQGG